MVEYVDIRLLAYDGGRCNGARRLGALVFRGASVGTRAPGEGDGEGDCGGDGDGDCVRCEEEDEECDGDITVVVSSLYGWPLEQ